MERSKAIKCPSVALHLAGCKKVQQVLSEPGVLEQFVDDQTIVTDMKKTFVGQVVLDQVSDILDFYAPISKDRGHIVLQLSVCLSVGLSVCTNLTWKLNIFPLLLN